MGKFKKHWFELKSRGTFDFGSRDGVNLSFEAEIGVNTSGQFYCQMPENIRELCGTMDIELERYYYSRNKSDEGFITEYTLDKLIEKVNRKLSPLVDFQIKERKFFIRYNFGGYVHYTNNSNDEIEFNGQRMGEYFWCGSETSSYVTEPYSVAIGLQVVEKITTLFGDGTEKIIEKHVNTVDKDKYPYLAELMRIIRIKSPSKYTEIEYTEQTARVFCSAILGIIKIYDGLQKFNHSEVFLDMVKNGENLLGFNEN